MTPQPKTGVSRRLRRARCIRAKQSGSRRAAEGCEEERRSGRREAELEEAQAEAEALLEAEAMGDGTVDARAEVRAPAATARLYAARAASRA